MISMNATVQTAPAGSPAKADPIARRIAQKLSVPTQNLLRDYKGGPCLALQQVLIEELNSIIQNGPLYDDQLFRGITLPERAKKLAKQAPKGPDMAQLNRLLLLLAFPTELSAEVSSWNVVLHGSNFRPTSVVYIDGTAIQGEGKVTFLDSRTLAIRLDGGAWKPGTTHSVSVINPGAEDSAADAVEIVLSDDSKPVVYSPPAIQAASSAALQDDVTKAFAGWNVTLKGQNFRPDSVVSFDGKPLPTGAAPKFIDAGTFSFGLSPGDDKSRQKIGISITNPDPNGGVSADFDLAVPARPQIRSAKVEKLTDPTGVTTGWKVTLTGLNFGDDSVITLDGKPLPSDETVGFAKDTASLTVSLRIANHKPGSIMIVVTNPEPNGAPSDVTKADLPS